MGTGLSTSLAVMVAKVVGRVPNPACSASRIGREMPLFSGATLYALSGRRIDAPPIALDTVLRLLDGGVQRASLLRRPCDSHRGAGLLHLSLWPAALALWSRTAPAAAN